jgi:hypothetical protein
MRNDNGEVHAETDEARGGSTPHIVRWILVISTLAAIVLLSAIWIFGAWSQGDVEEEVTATRIEQDREESRDTDAVVSEGFDEFAPDTSADVIEGEEVNPARTVENE